MAPLLAVGASVNLLDLAANPAFGLAAATNHERFAMQLFSNACVDMKVHGQ
ncbi:hypothetical protein LSAT2_024603, partial [Lamellibrachia satsuma]